MKAKIFIPIALILCFVSVTLYSTPNQAVNPYFANLTFKTNGGGVRPDYGMFIAQQLEAIGIDVDVIVEEWIAFIGILIVTYDFDIGIVALTGGSDPDPSGSYSEAGSLNMYGVDTFMPYGNESETMLADGLNIMDQVARQQHYYDWQMLLMDKIVPSLPLFCSSLYTATWSTLTGYDAKWGYVDSLPYMEWLGYHDGQESLTEFIVHDYYWAALNPLVAYDDDSSSIIQSLMMEPIVQISPGGEVLKTGLVDNWEQINQNHFSFHMREGVYWNPSYDVRTRNNGSSDLSLDTPVAGLKGLASDGTNQEVTAKDAVFTFLAWANDITSEDTYYYEWIADIWVDEADEYTFHIVIDRDPSTPELQLYASFRDLMTTLCLPEFFLNSTDTLITTSSGGVEMIGIYPGIQLEPAWGMYTGSAFGCGKYMLDYYDVNSVTVLQKSPYWFGVGAIDGTVQDLDIDTFIMRVITDQDYALDEFKAGKLDIMNLDAFTEERRQMQQDARFDVQDKLRNYLVFMFFNLRRPFVGGDDNYVFLTEPGKEEYTKGAAVRKAINYAIDRTIINEALHETDYEIVDSPMFRASDFWYNFDIIKYDYNLELAWEWMEAAGYSKSSLDDGITIIDPDAVVVTEYIDVTETVIVTEVETVTITESTTTTTTSTTTSSTSSSTTTNETTSSSTIEVSYPLTAVIFLGFIALIMVVRKIKKKR